LQIALLSLGCGTIISALTAKYRDLTFAMTFLVQLWMFATPIVYPLSLIPENYRFFAVLNPMTSIVEIFRGAFLGQSTISLSYILTSIALTLLLLIAGLFLFNRVEKNFMDTV
jgi:lipopolysaccharide transport system permease protein